LKTRQLVRSPFERLMIAWRDNLAFYCFRTRYNKARDN
jgi:hypothetical protein